MCNVFKLFGLLLLAITSTLFAQDHGIYINQGTLSDSKSLNFLISESKSTGINTFVVDLKFVTNDYRQKIQLIKSNGIRYVARIVIFDDGGEQHQVRSPYYWEKKYSLMKKAIEFGADEIQLDYIRYSTKRPPSAQNAKDVHEVIKWFKQRADQHKVPLQIDIFGEVSFAPSTRIGQNIQLFAPSIDAACPMVYPSHYKPYKEHFKNPYGIVLKSLKALRAQFNNKPPFRLIPYIEATNFRYRMSFEQKIQYIIDQINATQVAGTDGWYFWSANNHYGALFSALRQKQSSMAKR